MDIQSSQSNNVEKYRVDGMSLKNKMDKIAAAIHMVTDCIEDNEPIRFKLRSLAVELASEAHELIHTAPRDRGFIFSDIEIVGTEIMSFISIARSVRLISSMNADVLLRELTGNMERMRTWTETGFYEVEGGSIGIVPSGAPVSFTLNENHFKTEQPPASNFPSSSSFSNDQKNQKATPHPETHKGHSADETAAAGKQKQSGADNRKFEVAMKLNRRNTILKIIKDKKEVTIKDISMVIENCSEKTIQRELIDLVRDGVLKKVGEKRWSKYMLA